MLNDPSGFSKFEYLLFSKRFGKKKELSDFGFSFMKYYDIREKLKLPAERSNPKCMNTDS